jgi:hypothetical protein
MIFFKKKPDQEKKGKMKERKIEEIKRKDEKKNDKLQITTRLSTNPGGI